MNVFIVHAHAEPKRFNSACLLSPYLAWVSVAPVLNFTLWRLNRS